MDQLAAWQGVCASHSTAWPDESQYTVMPSGQITSQVRLALFITQLHSSMILVVNALISYAVKYKAR